MLCIKKTRKSRSSYDSYNENENITFTDDLCIRHFVNV